MRATGIRSTWISHMADCEVYGIERRRPSLDERADSHGQRAPSFSRFIGHDRIALGSALVAALFAIHPLHVESVAWVAERKDVLSGFFWILTMGAYTYYVKHPTIRALSPRAAVICPGSSVEADGRDASLCSAASRLLAPAAIYRAEDRLRPGGSAGHRRPAQPGCLRLVVEKMPLLFSRGLHALLRWSPRGRSEPSWPREECPIEVRLANAIVSYIEYIWKMLWPVDLAVSILTPECRRPGRSVLPF